MCDAALELAMARDNTPGTDGRPLSALQTVQLQLSQIHMLTETLRSFVARTVWARDRAVARCPAAKDFGPAIFVTNFSKTVIERVTELNMDIHRASGGERDAYADQLVQDAHIWRHLAGDSVMRMKAIRHYPH